MKMKIILVEDGKNNSSQIVAIVHVIIIINACMPVDHASYCIILDKCFIFMKNSICM